MTLNSDTVTKVNPWKNVPKKLLPFIVKKVIAVHETVNGGTYYSLQGVGKNEAVVDPRHDMPMYQRMIELVPEIATLPKRESIILARYWSVTPCATTRVIGNGKKDVLVPQTITELPPVERDFPAWAKSDDDMQDFADACHTVWSPAIAGNFLDTTFGLPRSAWPDRQTCIDKIAAIMKATGEQARNTPAAKPLTEWDTFDKQQEVAIVDDPKTDELNAMLEGLTCESDDPPDELVKHWSQDGTLYRDIASLFEKRSNSAKFLTECMKLAKAWHGVESYTDITVSKEFFLSWLSEELARRFDAPKNEGETTVTEQPQNKAQEGQQSTQKIASAISLPEAPFSANFRLVDPHGIDIQFTIRAETVNDGVKRTNAAIDHLLANGYAANRQTPQLPPNVTPMPQPVSGTLPPPVSSPAAQPAANGTPDSKGRVPGMVGTTVITSVKVVKDDGKTIIELWAGGQYAEHRLQQSNEHAMVGNLTNWSALEVGTKYPVSWISDWVVGNKRAAKGAQNYYLNVTGIRAAAQQHAA
jgi:hypothetical protein